MGLTFNRPTRKCARIIGDVMGKYHPHGDAPIYDALVRMAQPFSMRYPLMDGQGNFGSVDGDPPAADTVHGSAALAHRRRAARGHRQGDGRLQAQLTTTATLEPEVLPTRVPNMLINGSSGIAVGMATNIPPHNLNEIINATIALVSNPNMPLAKILEIVTGPDFPTGGYILGRRAFSTPTRAAAAT